MRDTAPKIVSFEIPIDKIGEVIGPKGKVINTIQQETGADISVSDDGVVGTVSIGSKDGAAGRGGPAPHRADPRPADRRASAPIYTGRVVNITKFGAFVNILPGRDGLLHISKLGRGKRIDRVEDVLSLGDELEVRVDDIDQTRASSRCRSSATSREGGERRRRRAARERATARPRRERAASAIDDRRPRRASDRGDRAPRDDRVVRGVLGRRRPRRSSATSVRPRRVRRRRPRPAAARAAAVAAAGGAVGGGGGGGGRRAADAVDRPAR